MYTVLNNNNLSASLLICLTNILSTTLFTAWLSTQILTFLLGEYHQDSWENIVHVTFFLTASAYKRAHPPPPPHAARRLRPPHAARRLRPPLHTTIRLIIPTLRIHDPRFLRRASARPAIKDRSSAAIGTRIQSMTYVWSVSEEASRVQSGRSDLALRDLRPPHDDRSRCHPRTRHSCWASIQVWLWQLWLWVCALRVSPSPPWLVQTLSSALPLPSVSLCPPSPPLAQP